MSDESKWPSIQDAKRAIIQKKLDEDMLDLKRQQEAEEKFQQAVKACEDRIKSDMKRFLDQNTTAWSNQDPRIAASSWIHSSQV